MKLIISVFQVFSDSVILTSYCSILVSKKLIDMVNINLKDPMNQYLGC